jgi:cysteine desulfurase family protein (TIGR01976 family)
MSTSIPLPTSHQPPTTEHFPITWCRAQFPALERQLDGQPVVFFDGPAGSQTPRRVIDAIANYLRETNANHGGLFATSRESDAMLLRASEAVADLLGVDSPHAVVFGQNMTSLTFALSRALARTWQAGDEVIVTRLDHDANVTPWVLAARDAGASVHYVNFHGRDCTLDTSQLERKLSPRTRLVAVGAASNAVGTVNPIEEICTLAHQAGAQVFVDAVHYAPHLPLDAARWNCDYVACSAYKFFGPHVGVMWGKPDLLQALPAYKVRPAADSLPDKWMTGTQNHEGIAGVLAAVEYLAELGRRFAPDALDRRAALAAALAEIAAYERGLCGQLIAGLAELASVRIWGITEAARFEWRVPTVSITHKKLPPAELADYLGMRGIFAWHGNFYALQVTESLKLEPAGLVRLGLLHYNTPAEVERLLAVLRQLE